MTRVYTSPAHSLNTAPHAQRCPGAPQNLSRKEDESICTWCLELAESTRAKTAAMFTVPPTTVGVAASADASALALQFGHTSESWVAAGHAYHPYSGRFEVNPYLPVGPPPPAAVIAASKREALWEHTPVTPEGLLLPGTRADTLFRMWLSPVGSRPASTPLLLVGASL